MSKKGLLIGTGIAIGVAATLTAVGVYLNKQKTKQIEENKETNELKDEEELVFVNLLIEDEENENIKEKN